jgi:methyl-accepting chemotaxis protein
VSGLSAWQTFGETAESTQQVSSNMAGVAEAADTTSDVAGELRTSSDGLQCDAKVLSEQMTGFFARLRAA